MEQAVRRHGDPKGVGPQEDIKVSPTDGPKVTLAAIYKMADHMMSLETDVNTLKEDHASLVDEVSGQRALCKAFTRKLDNIQNTLDDLLEGTDLRRRVQSMSGGDNMKTTSRKPHDSHTGQHDLTQQHQHQQQQQQQQQVKLLEANLAMYRRSLKLNVILAAALATAIAYYFLVHLEPRIKQLEGDPTDHVPTGWSWRWD